MSTGKIVHPPIREYLPKVALVYVVIAAVFGVGALIVITVIAQPMFAAAFATGMVTGYLTLAVIRIAIKYYPNWCGVIFGPAINHRWI
jgi:hypothetical protein